MGPISIKRAVAWITGVALAFGSTNCMVTVSDDEPSTRDSSMGSIALPLKTTAASGATYYLEHAHFVITHGHEVVAALNTAGDPEVELLSTELAPGTYTVALEDGWRLRKNVEGTAVSVPATLSSSREVLVQVSEDELSIVTFSFVTEHEHVSFERGSLGIRIAVEEKFPCHVARRLRVDPGAAHPGDGSSWSSPLQSVQMAIDLASACGGGEVWVRGPGPFEALSGDASSTLITLRDDVRLIGGFAGTEKRLQDRDPTAQTTIVGAAPDENDQTAPLIVGASRSLLSGFALLEHDGTSLLFEGAEDFEVENVTLQGGFVRGFGAHIAVSESSGSFDELEVRNGMALDGIAGIQLERSRVAVTNSVFARMYSIFGSAGVDAVNSALVLENVDFLEDETSVLGGPSGLSLEQGSDALALDVLWFRGTGWSPVEVRDSRFVAVHSTWEGNDGDGPTLLVYSGAEVQLLNTSFTDNRVFYPGTIVVVYRNGKLDVVNATFVDSESYTQLPGYAYDIGGVLDAEVSIYNLVSNRGELSIGTDYVGAGNCLLERDAALVYREDTLPREVLLTPELGCTDLGDEAAARAAANRAREFAEMLGANMPLKRGKWWRKLSSVYPLCRDAGPIDPGRHFAPTWCAE